MPTPKQIADRQTEACADPFIKAALQDPAVQAGISEAKQKSSATGREFGFEYGRSVLGGRGVTSVYGGTSGELEMQTHFSALMQGLYYREIEFHTHPEPTEPGLSYGPNSDLTMVQKGWRIVAIGDSGQMYCGVPK
jgi:hypothetical protein